MGSGASSLPPQIDKPTAKTAAGKHFDEAAFDGAAVNGVVSRDAFLSAASSLADRPAVVHTTASLMQCHSFLLGTHSRVGADSPVRKLPTELLKKVCAHVLQQKKRADWHFCCRSDTLGSVDFWIFTGDPEPPPPKIKKTKKKKKSAAAQNHGEPAATAAADSAAASPADAPAAIAPAKEELHAVLQQQLPGASTATRYLGTYGHPSYFGKWGWPTDEDAHPPLFLDWAQGAWMALAPTPLATAEPLLLLSHYYY